MRPYVAVSFSKNYPNAASLTKIYALDLKSLKVSLFPKSFFERFVI